MAKQIIWAPEAVADRIQKPASSATMSVKVLLDECLPKKLKYRIEELDPYFIVNTVPEINWDSLPDGKLLSKAENEFNVFITSDRNLSFQQSIPDTQIHVLLLIASTNIYEDLLPLVEKLTPVLKANKPGQFTQRLRQIALTSAPLKESLGQREQASHPLLRQPAASVGTAPFRFVQFPLCIL